MRMLSCVFSYLRSNEDKTRGEREREGGNQEERKKEKVKKRKKGMI